MANELKLSVCNLLYVLKRWRFLGMKKDVTSGYGEEAAGPCEDDLRGHADRGLEAGGLSSCPPGGRRQVFNIQQ